MVRKMQTATVVLAIILLLSTATAQEVVIDDSVPKNESVPLSNPPVLWRYRKTPAAIQRAFLTSPSSTRNTAWTALRDLESYLVGLEEAVAMDQTLVAGNVETATCNGPTAWSYRVQAYLRARLLPTIETGCVTERKDSPQNRAPDLAILHKALADASKNPWPVAHVVGEFSFNTTDQLCKLRRQAAVRVGDHWFLHAQLVNESLGAGGRGPRRLLSEHVRASAERGSFASLRVFLSADRPPDGDQTPSAGSTAFEWLPGPPAAGGVLGVPELEGNPALREALERAAADAEQANDATQHSNIAILALPLLLSLVPAALFADVNTLGLFVYAGLTDVLTAVPLAIKGAELLIIAANDHRAQAALYTGARSPGAAFAELFVATCRPATPHVSTGAVFLGTAAVAIVAGVVAELLARRYMRRRKPSVAYAPLGPAGAGLLQQGAAGGVRAAPHFGHPAGCACACHAHNHPHAHARAYTHGQLTHRSVAPMQPAPYPMAPAYPDVESIAVDMDYRDDYDSRPQLGREYEGGGHNIGTDLDYRDDYDSRPQLERAVDDGESTFR